MSRRILLVLLLVVVGGPAAWAQRPFPTDLMPSRTATARLGLERQWYSAVPLAGVDDRVLDFTVDLNVMVVHTSGGYIHAYDAESGRYLWGSSIGHKTAKAFPASVNSSQIFVTSLNELYGFDRATGRKLFKVDLEDLPSTATGCDEELVMVGLRSGKLVAYTSRDHTTDGTKRGQSAGSFAFAWQTKGMLTARPLVSPKVIAFGSADHRVYVALKKKSDNMTKLLFRYLTAGPISANLAAYGNRTLVIPSGDNNVYGIDLLNAETRWSVATGSPVDQEPLVAGQDVFAINDQGRVVLIDAVSGEVKWSTMTGCKVLLAVTPSRLYLVTDINDLMVIDRANGAIVSTPRDTVERAGLNLRPFLLRFPNYYDDRLYFSTPSGLVVCLREIGRSKPTTLRDPSLAPFGTIPKEGLLEEVEQPIYLTPSGELKVIPVPSAEGENKAAPEPAPEPENADPFAEDNAAPVFP